jgi:hypothetical protein
VVIMRAPPIYVYDTSVFPFFKIRILEIKII